MAASVKCPACLEIRDVPVSKLGNKLKCHSCGEVFVATELRSRTGRSSGRSKKGRGAKGPGSLAIGLIAGATVFVVLGVGLLLLMPSRPAGETTNPAGGAPTTAVRWMTPEPVESLGWTNNLNIEIEIKRSRPEFFPPSPFVGISADHFMSVYDLRTGKEVHKMPTTRMISSFRSLSPDGNLFASDDAPDIRTLPQEFGGGACGYQFCIRSTESGQQTMSTRPIPERARFEWAAFRSATELLVVSRHLKVNATDEFEVAIYDTTNNQSLRAFKLPGAGAQVFLLSPGGRYLVYLVHDEIVAFDLNAGQSPGSVTTRIKQFEPNFQIYGIAFSEDGKTLAVLKYDGPKYLKLLFLDVAKGSQDHEILLSDLPADYLKKVSKTEKSTGLRWLPGNNYFVVLDSLLVDASTGKAIADLRIKDKNLLSTDFVGNSMIRHIKTNDGTVLRSEKIPLP